MPSTLRKHNKLWVFILLSLLGFLVYANTCKGAFIWDDENLIVANPAIRSLTKIPDLFSQDMGGVQEDARYGFYRPLTMATYAINYALARFNVAAYHFTNVLLHILTAFCAYLLLQLIFRNELLALLAGVLFVIYPVHTEAVAYISGRADLLAALFILISFIVYLKYLATGSRRWLYLTLALYILALFSKENSLVFPFLLLLYHYTFKTKLQLKLFLLVLTPALLYLGLRFTVLAPLEVPSLEQVFYRIPGFFVAIVNYLRILILPFDLHYEYGNRLFEFYDWRALLGVVVVLYSWARACLRKNQDSFLVFSLGWFFITLLPNSSIYPVNAFYMSEHWLYLPSLGFFIILAKGFIDLHKIKNMRWLTLLLFLMLGLCYSFLTIKQNIYWLHPVSFYSRTLKYAPQSGQVYYNLGGFYFSSGRYLEASEAFRKSISREPKNFRTYNCLADTHYRLGNHSAAIQTYNKAIGLNPKNYRAYNNLGVIYDVAGDYQEAIGCYLKALQIKPNFSRAYFNLSALHFDLQDYELAAQYCDQAVALGYPVPADLLKLLAPYKK